MQRKQAQIGTEACDLLELLAFARERAEGVANHIQIALSRELEVRLGGTARRVSRLYLHTKRRGSFTVEGGPAASKMVAPERQSYDRFRCGSRDSHRKYWRNHRFNSKCKKP